MDALAQRLLNVVADRQVATGKTVSLTALRTSVMPPPADHQVLAAIDGALADLVRRRMVERHTEKGNVVAYTLTADAWWASTYREKADKVVHDLLGLFRKAVQHGKPDFDQIPWDVVKEAAKVIDAEIHLYQLVSHQVRLTGGWVSPVPERPGGRLVASFTRPSDFDEILNLSDVEFLSRRQRERHEERLVGHAVPSDARTVISRAYQHLVREGEWPLTRSFNVELRKIGINLSDVATENGGLIWGTNLTDAGERTHLTLSALALVPDAEHDVVIITNIIRQLGKAYDGDPNTLDVPVLTVAAASGLSDPAILSRLVRIIGAQGAPFVVQGKPKYPLDSSTFGTGDRMLDLIEAETLDDIVRVLKEKSQRYGGVWRDLKTCCFQSSQRSATCLISTTKPPPKPTSPVSEDTEAHRVLSF